MDLHYNAFISYRHHPEDIKVASGIHRALERYKVPKAIRKKTKGITRIFRDKEELPITSNLTEDLTRALKNSDFLIVICSTHTKESIWVQREIDTFLQTHSKNKILTVLVDGEPYDVIPEILQYDEITDPATGEVRRIPVEPLSCDWRSNNRRVRREELSRLAAALLDCGYDELRQRQRQHRIRQMIAGFSGALAVSLALTAYFVYTSLRIQKANDDLQAANEQIQQANDELQSANERIQQANDDLHAANLQIQSNYEEALRNQSQYLAEASSERLEAGDRLTAIALAVEALPDASGDRPYYPAAEMALNYALSTYDPASQIAAVGSFNPGALVELFVVSDDGGTIYIQDARGLITCWNTDTFERTGSIDFGQEYFDRLWVTAEGNLLVFTTDDALFCYSPEGSLLWEVADCWDLAFLDDKKTVMVMEFDYSTGSRIRFLDPQTGEDTSEALTLWEEEEKKSGFYFSQESYVSGQNIVLTRLTFDENYNDTVYMIYLVAPESGVVSHLMTAQYLIQAVSTCEDGRVLVMAWDGSGYYNGFFMEMQTTSMSRDEIFCFDGETRKLLWKSECISYLYSSHNMIQEISGTGQILCQKDNVFQLMDGKTGEILSVCEAPSGVLDVSLGDGYALAVLQDGSLCNFKYADASCYSTKYMEDELTASQIQHGIYTIRSLGSQVTVYRTLVGENWQGYAGEYSTYDNKHRSWGNLVAVFDYDEIFLFDMDAQRLLWSLETGYGYEMLGFSGDGAKLWFLNKYDDLLVSFDPQTGDQTTAELPLQIGEKKGYRLNPYYYAEDHLFYLTNTSVGQYAVCLDMSTMQTRYVLLPEREDALGVVEYTGYVAANTQYGWLWSDEGNLYELHWESQTLTSRAQEVSEFPAITVHGEENLAAAACGHELILFVPGGGETGRFSLGERKAGSLCFYGDQILALCDDGSIYRYSFDGTLLSSTGLSLYNTFYSSILDMDNDPLKVTWEFTNDGDLLIDAFSAGNLVDCEQWQVRAFVPNYVTYYGAADSIVTTNDGSMGAMPCYSTEELLEVAREELNGFELTEEQRRNYGLD